MPTKLPDLKVFLSDPAHQADKDFFFGLFDEYLRVKAEEAAKNKKPEAKTFLQQIFDPE